MYKIPVGIQSIYLFYGLKAQNNLFFVDLRKSLVRERSLIVEKLKNNDI